MVALNDFLCEIAKPTGLWAIILEWIESFTSNFGWTIILFTILIKLAMLPLDFYNRYSTRKNTLIQKRLAPQIAKINQKYKNNNTLANQQASALYQKEGYNVMGSCLFMLINLVLTMVIFFTIFDSLREMSTYKMLTEYQTLEITYDQALTESGGNVEYAQNQTVLKYDEIRENSEFLWIKSIWRKDTSNSVIPKYKELGKEIKTSENKTYTEYYNSISEEKYAAVTAGLNTKYDSWNGYYILGILALGVSFLSQYISDLANKTKKEKNVNMADPAQASMKFMKILLPAIMLIFTITNTASFGIYIIISSVMGILTTLVCNIFVKKFTKTEEEKYNAFLEKYIQQQAKVKQQEQTMKTYKNLGDKLWNQSKYQEKP